MRRRGYLLIEVFVACTMVAALLALVVNMIAVTARERRATERRAIALEHATNLLERASAIPHEELSSEKLAEFTLPPDAESLLPKHAVQWTIADEDSDIPTKRMQVELTWQSSHGQREAPIRLVGWAMPASIPVVAPAVTPDAESSAVPEDAQAAPKEASS